MAEAGAAVVLMHMVGNPRTMQVDPRYGDVVVEVRAALASRIAAAEALGIPRVRIAIDPGIGFGKTLEHNLALLRGLERFPELAPVMVGLSRKATIGTLTGRTSAADRAAGSAAAALIAVQRGAMIVRVHDVAVTRDALAVWSAVAAGDALAKRASPGAKKSSLWADD